MLTFLVWNVAKMDLRPAIAALAVEHRMDMLVLVEFELLETLRMVLSSEKTRKVIDALIAQSRT